MDDFDLVLRNGTLTVTMRASGRSTSYKLPEKPGARDSMGIYYHFKSAFEPIIGEQRFRELDEAIDEIIEGNFSWRDGHVSVDYKDAHMTRKLAAQEESIDDKARKFIDEGLVSSMAEARRYAVAGVTPERMREMRKSQPLRMRRDYGSRKASSDPGFDEDDEYHISVDKRSGWGPEAVTIYHGGLPMFYYEFDTRIDPKRHFEPVKREARRKGRPVRLAWQKSGKEWVIGPDGSVTGPVRSKDAHYAFDDLAFIDVSAGGNFEVRLPGRRSLKAGTSDDAYALVQKYVEKSGTPLKIVDIPRGSTRAVDARGNILDGRVAMEDVTKRIDAIADGLEMHGMREAAERLDVVSNTIEAQNWGASRYEGGPWSNEPWGKDPTKAMRNFHKALEMLGWKGGTVHQVARELGVDLEDLRESDDIESLVKGALEKKGKSPVAPKEAATMVGEPSIVKLLRREGFDVTRYPGEAESRSKGVREFPGFGVHMTYNWRVGAPPDKVFDVDGIEQEDVILNIAGPGEKGQEFSGWGDDVKYEVYKSYPVESSRFSQGGFFRLTIIATDKEQELILKLKRMLKPEGFSR